MSCMTEYKTQSIENLVDELRELRDEDLARRVLETSDVEWCLSELYDYLHEDVVKVVRCKNCVNARPLNRNDRYENSYAEGCVWCIERQVGMLPEEYCSDGECKGEDKQ